MKVETGSVFTAFCQATFHHKNVLFKNMENPLIAGRIQLERFISVEVFEKVGNTFRGITCFLNFTEILACVASVSVWFRSKERPRNGILGFGRARNETRAKKMKVVGGGREGRKRLQANPSILKTCVRQRTQRLIGSASRTMLTCVDQRFVSY